MSLDQPRAPSAASRATLALIVTVFVAGLLAVSSATAYLAGGIRLPGPINDIITGAALGAIIILAVRRHLEQIREEWREGRRETREVLAAIERRTGRIQTALVAQGGILADVTGEIPRIVLSRARGVATVTPADGDLDEYAKGYTDGLARLPMLDPAVVPVSPAPN